MMTPTGVKDFASFDDLAPEILLMIITKLKDMVSLGFYKGITSTFRLFNLHAVEIMETVLASGETCGHTRLMICITALIRSETLPIPNLKSFREKVTIEAMKNRVRTLKEGLGPVHLEKSTRLATNGYPSSKEYRTNRHLFDTSQPLQMVFKASDGDGSSR